LGRFYRFIGAGKFLFGFFYRFIGDKNFGQQNCIALFDFFLKNCVLYCFKRYIFEYRCPPLLTISLSKRVCRGQEGPKGTLRPDFQANTGSMLFKKPVSPQKTGRRL
jgi:hypothetical protein